MSSSPEQSNSFQTPSLNVSQDISDVSVISAASIGSGGESPPTGFQGHTLSPPQLINVCAASSTPNSPHLGGNRRNKGIIIIQNENFPPQSVAMMALDSSVGICQMSSFTGVS